MNSGARGVRLAPAPGGWTLQDSAPPQAVAVEVAAPPPSLDDARGHERAGRLDEAEGACRRLLDRDARDAGALHLLGVVRGRLGDAEEATRLLERAADLCPGSAEIYNDLGVTWEMRGDFDRAAGAFRRAAHARPGLQVLWVNLANALVQSGLPGAAEEALAAAREALRMREGSAAAHNAHGMALSERGEAVQARLAFAEAVRLQPDFAQARANLGLALLRGGDFSAGWREHEWRRADRGRFPARPGQPWEGGELKGRSVLLYGEGGLGNVIQFARFAVVLAERGADVTVECQPELVALLRTMKGVRVVSREETAPRSPQLHCPLMSVPAVLGTNEEALGGAVPYLCPEPERVARWAEVLQRVPGFRVGVCWRGDQRQAHMRGRSFDPALLRALAEVPGVTLVNLQHGEPPPQGLPLVTLPGLEPLGPGSMKLEDVAAVMKGLDLVVSCDTAIAHLAGALGVPAWVALKSAACWRWMSDRDDSPWYPSLRLFRQWEPGDWAGVLARMAKALAPLAAGTAGDKETSVSERSPFAYFGAAVVLNLDADADRMARVAGRLRRLGVEFERFAAVPAPADLVSRDPRVRPGHYACAMTHRAALRRALESGLERVLIFEDDVHLRDDAGRWLRRIVPQLCEVEWDVFYLGLHLEEGGRRLGDNLLEVRRGFHTHAYAVARKAMPRLIAWIDRVLERLAGTFDDYEDATLLKVCATPILAVQEPGLSHTFGLRTDRLAQYFRFFDGDDFRRHCREAAEWRVGRTAPGIRREPEGRPAAAEKP